MAHHGVAVPVEELDERRSPALVVGLAELCERVAALGARAPCLVDPSNLARARGLAPCELLAVRANVGVEAHDGLVMDAEVEPRRHAEHV